jgi:hypothetical protein
MYNIIGMEDRKVANIITHNSKRRRNTRRPKLHGGANIPFKRAEQNKHGLIHNDDDDGVFSTSLFQLFQYKNL